MKISLAIAAALLALAGCAHVIPHFNTMGYDSASMEIIGPATGSATLHYVLGIGPSGGDKNLALVAYDNAVTAAGADAVINIVADDTTSTKFFWLYYRRDVTIKGLAVRFKKK